jgi:hypothetical protein
MILGILRETFRRRRLYTQIRKVECGSLSPVVVYQMGKVASSTIEATLTQVPSIVVFRTHGLARSVDVSSPGQARRELESWLVYHRIIVPKLPAKVVTLVRDPISRNVSAYFQNLDQLWGMDNAHARLSMEQIIEGFFQKQPHERALNWFDREFKAILGVDVYAHPFDLAEGFQHLQQQSLQILILKTSLDDQIKARELGRLVGTNNLSFVQKNLGAEKSYSAVYDQFVRSIQLPDEYVKGMLEHRFTQHFFSPSEIDAIRRKWKVGGSVSSK